MKLSPEQGGVEGRPESHRRGVENGESRCFIFFSGGKGLLTGKGVMNGREEIKDQKKII